MENLIGKPGRTGLFGLIDNEIVYLGLDLLQITRGQNHLSVPVAVRVSGRDSHIRCGVGGLLKETGDQGAFWS